MSKVQVLVPLPNFYCDHDSEESSLDREKPVHQLPGAALVRYRKHRTAMRSGPCGETALRLPHGQPVLREPFERDVAPYPRPDGLMKRRNTLRAFQGGHSSTGRALDCGSNGCEFEPHWSPRSVFF